MTQNNTELYLELQDVSWPFTYTDHDRQIARAIVYDDDGFFYFVRVRRDDDFGKATLIETSGGGIEPGEDPETAIKRELKEELGAEVEIACKIGVVSDYYNLIHRHNINNFFLCRALSFGSRNLTQQEIEDFHLSIRKLTYDEALDEYESLACTPLGTLIRNRELPILHRAAEILYKQKGAKMDFIELAKKRYSVRSFKQDQVPDDAILKIIQAGCIAPTACNKQPFRIIAAKSPNALERFRKCTECHYDAPLGFIICRDKNEEWVRSYDGKRSGDIDASIVTTQMMLEAADLGIGSVWVMYFDPEAVRTEFALPENIDPVALLPLGYPSDDSKPSPSHTSFRPFGDIVSII